MEEGSLSLVDNGLPWESTETFINISLCIRTIMSDAKKTGQSDFAENPRSKWKLLLKISHNEKMA